MNDIIEISDSDEEIVEKPKRVKIPLLSSDTEDDYKFKKDPEDADCHNNIDPTNFYETILQVCSKLTSDDIKVINQILEHSIKKEAVKLESQIVDSINSNCVDVKKCDENFEFVRNKFRNMLKLENGLTYNKPHLIDLSDEPIRSYADLLPNDPRRNYKNMIFLTNKSRRDSSKISSKSRDIKKNDKKGKKEVGQVFINICAGLHPNCGLNYKNCLLVDDEIKKDMNVVKSLKESSHKLKRHRSKTTSERSEKSEKENEKGNQKLKKISLTKTLNKENKKSDKKDVEKKKDNKKLSKPSKNVDQKSNSKIMDLKKLPKEKNKITNSDKISKERQKRKQEDKDKDDLPKRHKKIKINHIKENFYNIIFEKIESLITKSPRKHKALKSKQSNQHHKAKSTFIKTNESEIISNRPDFNELIKTSTKYHTTKSFDIKFEQTKSLKTKSPRKHKALKSKQSNQYHKAKSTFIKTNESEIISNPPDYNEFIRISTKYHTTESFDAKFEQIKSLTTESPTYYTVLTSKQSNLYHKATSKRVLNKTQTFSNSPGFILNELIRKFTNYLVLFFEITRQLKAHHFLNQYRNDLIEKFRNGCLLIQCKNIDVKELIKKVFEKIAKAKIGYSMHDVYLAMKITFNGSDGNEFCRKINDLLEDYLKEDENVDVNVGGGDSMITVTKYRVTSPFLQSEISNLENHNNINSDDITKNIIPIQIFTNNASQHTSTVLYDGNLVLNQTFSAHQQLNPQQPQSDTGLANKSQGTIVVRKDLFKPYSKNVNSRVTNKRKPRKLTKQPNKTLSQDYQHQESNNLVQQPNLTDPSLLNKSRGTLVVRKDLFKPYSKNTNNRTTNKRNVRKLSKQLNETLSWRMNEANLNGFNQQEMLYQQYQSNEPQHLLQQPNIIDLRLNKQLNDTQFPRNLNQENLNGFNQQQMVYQSYQSQGANHLLQQQNITDLCLNKQLNQTISLQSLNQEYLDDSNQQQMFYQQYQTEEANHLLQQNIADLRLNKQLNQTVSSQSLNQEYLDDSNQQQMFYQQYLTEEANHLLQQNIADLRLNKQLNQTVPPQNLNQEYLDDPNQQQMLYQYQGQGCNNLLPQPNITDVHLVNYSQGTQVVRKDLFKPYSENMNNHIMDERNVLMLQIPQKLTSRTISIDSGYGGGSPVENLSLNFLCSYCNMPSLYECSCKKRQYCSTICQNNDWLTTHGKEHGLTGNFNGYNFLL